MKYANLDERIMAYLIDYLVIIMPLFIGTSYIIGTYFREYIDIQEYPFILIILLVFPIYMYGHLLMYPSIFYIKIVIVSGIVIILLETSLLILMEFIAKGNTIGKNIYKIKVTTSDHESYTIGKRVCRALLKSVSRNLMFIPCISVLFTMKRQSIYDILLKTIVIKNIEN